MAEADVYPIPEGARSVLVFGGTFDPPHRAHVTLPLAVRDAIGADWLLYIPAGRSPHKTRNPVASDADRLAMLGAALEGTERVAISTIECAGAEGPDDSEASERPPSYTVDTLERLSGLAGSTRLRLLIGADQAASFHRWREPERIIGLAEPVVMLRPPHEDRGALLGALGRHWPKDELDRWSHRIVEAPVMDVSATRVRSLLGAGAIDDPEVTGALPPGVLRVIRERALYRGG